MSENREEILADFQACTGVEDVIEAITLLDDVKWDLLAAIQRVMPTDTQTLPSESVARSSSSVNGGVILSPDFVHVPSTSHGKTVRRLSFHVNFNDRMAAFTISDSATISDLKNMVCGNFEVPVCQQTLTGWFTDPESDLDTLSSLKLPRENLLFLTATGYDVNGMDAMSTEELLSRTYTLKVYDESKKKEHILSYPGSKTVEEVKADVHTITDIPVKHQSWSGWPTSTDDSTTLAGANLSYPRHHLRVKAMENSDNLSGFADMADSDSSVEEFEDASESLNDEDENMFVDNYVTGRKKFEPLMPEAVEGETVGCIHFADEFANRYGAMHPNFFKGTLDEAIKESCLKPASERKLLAVYLHHDASVLANVFCTQLLCFEPVLQLLEANFLVWGWDLTDADNKTMFMSSLSRSLGLMAGATIRNIDTSRYPVLLVIMRVRSTTEIYSAVHGNVGVNELLTSLIQAIDVFTEQQVQDVKEEEERNLREMIKFEQDKAYEASLEIDRAKAEAKMHQELVESQERQRKESERQEKEDKKEAERMVLESELPDEPEENSLDDITKIRFRQPSGEFLERRFLASCKLQDLLNYLVVQGYHTEDFKVISSWPRRDLTVLDGNSSLQQLNLCPQETLILEER